MPFEVLRARTTEFGATIVEGAIVSVLFFSVIFGLVELGTLFADYSATSNLTRIGARTATSIGNQSAADFRILKTLQAGRQFASGDISFVVVFKAPSATAVLKNITDGTKCAAGTPVPNVCNVYRPADFKRPESDFDCSASAPDRFWCPTDRKVGLLTGPNGPPDFVGVYVRAEHRMMTGFFGTKKSLRDQTVMRMEPQIL